MVPPAGDAVVVRAKRQRRFHPDGKLNVNQRGAQYQGYLAGTASHSVGTSYLTQLLARGLRSRSHQLEKIWMAMKAKGCRYVML